MDTTHWADWADTFKLQDAACLIAGVSPAKEMVAWADKLPPEARPAFKKLWDSYMRGTGAYKRSEPDSADFPRMLHGIPSEDFRVPTSVPARGAIRRPEMLVPPSAELMRTRLESVRVSRSELHRWVKAMGIKSAYSFAPVATALDMDTAPAQTPAPVVPELDYSLLATPNELMDAFGKWGMDAAWFDDLNSRQWLLDARRKKGQGQRGHVIEPLFCPFAVMTGLIEKVRKAKRLQPDTAWRTLEHKFPKVYAEFAEFDPRDLTGD